jgi:uncharacterized protein (TIGR03435 family)
MQINNQWGKGIGPMSEDFVTPCADRRPVGSTLLLAAALIASVVAPATLAQEASAKPPDAATAEQANMAGAVNQKFDVVSVKPVSFDARPPFMGIQFTPDGIHASGPMSVLIRMAYGGATRFRTDDSIAGLPGWAKSQVYDIECKMTAEQAQQLKKLPNEEQQRQRGLMVQSMLEERFGLKTHVETKRGPVYELVVAKGGPKMKEGDANSGSIKGPDGKPVQGVSLRMRAMGKVEAQGLGMGQLANFLSQAPVGLGRLVEDKTGLMGKYNFALDWAPEPGLGATGGPISLPAPAADGADGPSIFTALEEQLGLRLEPGTAMVDVLVVDHIEQPGAD